MSTFSLEEGRGKTPTRKRRTTLENPATKDWEHYREHDTNYTYEHKPSKQELEKRQRRIEANEKGAAEFRRSAGVVMDAMKEQAKATPFTGEQYKVASDIQTQEAVNKAKDYKNLIKSLITVGELGMSGGSLLGAYANYKNWANSANLTKQTIANLLQRAQAPMQAGGVMIDGYQAIDSAIGGNTFDAYYNTGSGILGSAGYIGARDVYRGRNPRLDRFLDALGIIQNVGDFVKFGYDTYKSNKRSLEDGGK